MNNQNSLKLILIQSCQEVISKEIGIWGKYEQIVDIGLQILNNSECGS